MQGGMNSGAMGSVMGAGGISQMGMNSARPPGMNSMYGQQRMAPNGYPAQMQGQPVPRQGVKRSYSSEVSSCIAADICLVNIYIFVHTVLPLIFSQCITFMYRFKSSPGLPLFSGILHPNQSDTPLHSLFYIAHSKVLLLSIHYVFVL